MPAIKVVIHGASGRVGRVLVDFLYRESDIRIVGAVDIKPGRDRLELGDGSQVPFSADLDAVLAATRPDVMVDFSLAPATLPAARLAAKYKVNLVIGTTGLTAENLAEIEQMAQAGHLGVIVASNFALGAVLMARFAREASRYLDYAEIIELHHDQKADAPSGTALNTARAMVENKGKPFSPTADAGKEYPSRGQKVGGVTIHSVRLPGLMAHQEVIFGGLGQTLTIRHDTINRECYVPGVLLAIRAVVKQPGFVQGLEKLLIF